MKFETTLLQNGNNTGIEVPADVVDALGGGKRAAVTLEVNGFRFSSTLAVMGGRVLVPFSASKRAETGLSGGDQVTVEIGLDTAPRTVEVPSDLAEALEESGTRAAFDRLPPSARKAQVSNVENAKAAATRSRRISAIISKLSSP